jgi:regulator of RNase E activity RraA
LLCSSQCAHVTTWRTDGVVADAECLPHVAAEEPELVLGVEGNSLKTEEKTRSAGRCMFKR